MNGLGLSWGDVRGAASELYSRAEDAIDVGRDVVGCVRDPVDCGERAVGELRDVAESAVACITSPVDCAQRVLAYFWDTSAAVYFAAERHVLRRMTDPEFWRTFAVVAVDCGQAVFLGPTEGSCEPAFDFVESEMADFIQVLHDASGGIAQKSTAEIIVEALDYGRDRTDALTIRLLQDPRLESEILRAARTDAARRGRELSVRRAIEQADRRLSIRAASYYLMSAGLPTAAWPISVFLYYAVWRPARWTIDFNSRPVYVSGGSFLQPESGLNAARIVVQIAEDLRSTTTVPGMMQRVRRAAENLWGAAERQVPHAPFPVLPVRDWVGWGVPLLAVGILASIYLWGRS